MLARTTMTALTAIALMTLPATAAGPAKPAEKAATPSAGTAMTVPGLPEWKMPAQYSVDLVMSHEGQGMTMTRFVDGDRIRTEMDFEGRKMIMLERPEDGGAIYNIMPSEKMVMKMTPEKPEEAAGEAKEEKPADVKIEKLGAEKLDGRAALKYRMSAEGHTMLAWFEEGTGAPMRMESEDAVIEWKNFKPGPVPAKQFELPKDYQVIDMAEQMKQMKAMGGMGAMAGAGRGMKPGMGGPGAGVGGMMGGMAGGMGQQMGSGMGQSLGQGVGASLGGPLGAMAGGYIGGKVGGWLGHKAADAVTPGPSSK